MPAQSYSERRHRNISIQDELVSSIPSCNPAVIDSDNEKGAVATSNGVSARKIASTSNARWVPAIEILGFVAGMADLV